VTTDHLASPAQGLILRTVAVLSPHDVVAVGVNTMLTSALPGLRVVDAAHGEPDVLLYDVYALLDGDTSCLDHWVKETASIVVALTRPLRPDLGALALDRGAQAAVALSATSAEIASVVQSACSGTLDDSAVAQAAEHGTHLGQVDGLSARETDVLRLITLGRSNTEIAAELYLSVNSIKTYIRSAYRKIGVSTRPQVVAWCMQHGFPPPPD
jgi:DNA-binding NarL/FixJ family response regulator